MQKPKPSIPAFRIRIYWAAMLLMVGGLVWVFAPLLLDSVSVGHLLYKGLRADENYKELSKKYDEAINQFNKSYSLQNRYGFTDVNHSYIAADTMVRIAILGDSYIWGDGLHYTQTWNHQLAARLNLNYTNVEVLHWGRNGWNYPDHHRWMMEEGKKFKVDLVLLGWCDNDVFGEDQDSLVRFQQQNEGKGYSERYRQYVLRKENLTKYLQSMVDIRDTLARHHIRFVVYLTSHPHNNFENIKGVLRNNFEDLGIEYYDPRVFMGEVVPNTLIGDHRLNANGVNGHSGFLLNYLKAEAAFKWINNQPLMTQARARRLPHPTAVDRWRAR